MTEQRLRHKIIVGVIPFEGNLNLLSGQENRKMINLDHGDVRGGYPSKKTQRLLRWSFIQ